MANRPRIRIVNVLTSEQLDLALGRSNVIHAALLAGPASDTFLSRSQMLVRYRMADEDRTAAVDKNSPIKRPCEHARLDRIRTAEWLIPKRLATRRSVCRPRPCRSSRGSRPEPCARASATAGPSRSWWKSAASAASAGTVPPRPHAPEPVVAKPAAPAPAARPAPPPAPPRNNSGVVLRTLTEDERCARASALADAKVRDVEERRIAEEEAKRRASREGIEQAEREAAEARRKAEEERHRHDEEAKRKAELEAKKRFGEAEAPATRRRSDQPARPAIPVARAPGIAADASDEDEGPRPIRRGPGGAMRPAVAPEADREAGAAETTRPSDAGHGAQCRRRPRALDRLVPPPHPAPQGSPVQRAKGKADPRGHHPGSHQHPGTRQPHVGARRRRHPPADEAGRDAQDHGRDRRRHRAADRRGTGSLGQARGGFRRRRRPVRRRRQIPPTPSRARPW